MLHHCHSTHPSTQSINTSCQHTMTKQSNHLHPPPSYSPSSHQLPGKLHRSAMLGRQRRPRHHRQHGPRSCGQSYFAPQHPPGAPSPSPALRVYPAWLLLPCSCWLYTVLSCLDPCLLVLSCLALSFSVSPSPSCRTPCYLILSCAALTVSMEPPFGARGLRPAHAGPRYPPVSPRTDHRRSEGKTTSPASPSAAHGGWSHDTPS